MIVALRSRVCLYVCMYVLNWGHMAGDERRYLLSLLQCLKINAYAFALLRRACRRGVLAVPGDDKAEKDACIKLRLHFDMVRKLECEYIFGTVDCSAE